MKSAALFAVAALAATGLAGGPARAQSAESELQACVASSSGRVRIVPRLRLWAHETARLAPRGPPPAGWRGSRCRASSARAWQHRRLFA
jgi:hypothetical protein